MSTGNPLVATAGSSADPWAGVWIAEDIRSIYRGVKDGSWIEGTLGGVSAGLDALALVSDPIGSLLQYGVAWIIEHVEPLREALDWLAGDPGQIKAHAQTWTNVAGALHDRAADLDRAVRWDTTEWTGAAADAYRTWTGQQKAAVDALANAAETLASITEAAGILVAGVRMLVRDGIATLVSRLIVYAAEEVASLGLATPLVIEQVSTLCASWAARIARWLKDLVASLSRLRGAASKIAELIEKIKSILGKLGNKPGKGGKDPVHKSGGPSRDELLEELADAGVKHDPEKVILIGKDLDGKIVFLESGNAKAGLQHVMDHADQFADIGVPRDKVGQFVFDAVTTGNVIGHQGKGTGRPIYEFIFEGRPYKVAVTVGNNGFIVGANPVGH
ncbi:WXG100 family type VII secretion target [Actinoplanes sp. NPDC049596]|uniref:WXG100 family type VII secretion target n=1 Tax=unclassified Actinoplanes TaxID=2626549 RepID=UPI003423AEE1